MTHLSSHPYKCLKLSAWPMALAEAPVPSWQLDALPHGSSGGREDPRLPRQVLGHWPGPKALGDSPRPLPARRVAHGARERRACRDRVLRVWLVLQPALASRVVVDVVAEAAVRTRRISGTEDPGVARVPPTAAAHVILAARCAPEDGAARTGLATDPSVGGAGGAARPRVLDTKSHAPHERGIAGEIEVVSRVARERLLGRQCSSPVHG